MDLPEPVPPTKMIKPRFFKDSFCKTGGRLSDSNEGTWLLIIRKTKAVALRCTMALTRKRAIPGRLMAKLHSLVLVNSSNCLGVMMV